MDFQPFINTIAQAGVWCIAAFIMGKMFVDYVKKDRDNDRQDMKDERLSHKDERERLYSVVEQQGKLLEQQKEILAHQVMMSEHNKDMLDKLTSIQMLHTNRLDKIEEKQTILEEEIKKIGSRL